MIDLLVPYKEDSTDRAQNKIKFIEHYKDYYNIVMLENYETRASAFNKAAKKSTSEYIALADIDAIIPYKMMNSALFMLANGHDVVYPYSHIINLQQDGTETDDWPRAFVYGMMVCFNRQVFLDFGGENEEFIGYGWEDLERYYRALNNGYVIGRVDGTCYHMTHPRYGFENPYFNYNMMLMNKEKAKWKAAQ